jgi:preprotein translocase subunit SecG
MYCATCGNSVNENLNYCNICGAKIVKNGGLQVRNSATPILSIAVGFFGIAGLFGFIMMLKILLESRLDQPAVLTILIAYLVTLFLLCSVIIGQIWKPSGETKVNSNQTPEDYAAPPKQFRTVNTNQLEEAREPFIGSVTDNTTRTLDKVPLKEN